MASPAFGFSKEQYSKLRANKLPAAIENDAENERLTKELASLDARFDSLSPEEKRLASLLTVLTKPTKIRTTRFQGPHPPRAWER